MLKLLLPLAVLLSNCSSSSPKAPGESEQERTEQGTSVQQEQRAAGIAEQTQEQKVPVKQGIAGQVWWEAGNRMPSPDAPQSSGRKGVQRTIYIYELTNGSQTTTTDGVFHTNIKTNLVAQVVTDADGKFSVALKPGKYSLFTKEEKGFYANLFDDKNNIFPVEVKEGEVTNVEFLINYKAYY